MGRQRRSRPQKSGPSHGRQEITGPEALPAHLLDQVPEAQTVIYIHGIGNKPPASVLKCQWDHALFGVGLGDRSRMAYWVNREYYPVPLQETCQDQDQVATTPPDPADAAVRAVGLSLGAEDPEVKEEVAALVRGNKRGNRSEQTRVLQAAASRMMSHATVERSSSELRATRADVTVRVIPLPLPARQWLARELTKALLRDVNDFLYRQERRQAMMQSLRDRLDAGGAPFVVVSHSQGTMIAYEVLRQLAPDKYPIPLFVTMGSPLGMEEVRDVLLAGARLPVAKPPCVGRWVNVADRLDPVAIHDDLSDVFTPIENHAAAFLNPDSPWHPHSGTGYLRTSFVQEAVRSAVGPQFPQATGRFAVARDLVNVLEDSYAETRHSVLVQLADPEAEDAPDDRRQKIAAEIRKIVGRDPERAQIEQLKRFVAAQLTRSEIERFRTWLWATFKTAPMDVKVWRDSIKRALVWESVNTVQARPAAQAYGATGLGVHWAILDTGVQANHPHFATYGNVSVQWDCTQTGPAVEQWTRPAAGAKPKGGAFPVLDGNGHGTHVAGIVAGQAPKEIQVNASEPPVKLSGMATQATLHSYKVLDDQGNGRDSWIIKALDHISDVNDRAGRLVIHGVNLSLGGSFDPTVYGCGHSPLCQELRRLWRQGVLVCLAAGNEGHAFLETAQGALEANMALSIGDPANLEEAIAVASVHKTNPHTYGISYFSSRGPTADGRRKPDLVAPGERIWSALNRFKESAEPTLRELYVEMSGTSMATPHVSGLLAAFLGLRKEFIGEPDRVKKILLRNCTDLGRDCYTQGRGLPNLIKMLATT